jgi:hypothetical protein
MITYPLSNRDSLRVVMARVPAAGVRFICPAIQQFFDDERAGLCTVEVKRLVTKLFPTDEYPGVQHEVRVRYEDPELEFERKLSI